MRITTLELTGYKKYADTANIEFGDITVISGENGTGKSTIADAVAFLLYGVDSFGGKDMPANLFDPMDTVVKADLTDDNGTLFSMERHIVKGKSKLFINDVPVKATEFKEVVEQYFTKERFLTLFNPTFFATQHWTAQREQFMANVEQPLNATVLDACGDVLKNSLGPELKEMDIDKLEAKQRHIKKTTDAEIIKLRERWETYKKMTSTDKVDTSGIQKELQAIEKEAEQWEIYNEGQNEYKAIQKELDRMNDRLAEQAEIVNIKKASEPLAICTSCGQDLPEDKKAEVAERIAAELEKEKTKGKEMVAARKELKEKLAAHASPAAPEAVSWDALMERKFELQNQMTAANAKDYTQEIEETHTELLAIGKKNAAATSKIDEIKIFRAMQTTLMLDSIAELFDRLSLKLFNYLANGSMETTFEIEYDGKPYRTLSTAERILAGIELRNAFIELTAEQESAPIFIDCAESISKDAVELTDGQVIVAEVKRSEFKIETKERELA